VLIFFGMKYFSLLLILLFPLNIIASSNPTDTTATHKSRVFLEVSPGVSIPVGFYARDQVSDNQSGYASNGFLLHLDCDWMGIKILDSPIRYIYQKQPFEIECKIRYAGRMDIPVGTGGWSDHYLMIGPVYLKSWGKLTVDIKGMAGVVLATSPLFRTIDPAQHTPSGNTGTGFAFSLGGSCGYSVSPEVSVFIEAGYLQGNQRFTGNTEQNFFFSTNMAMLFLCPYHIRDEKNTFYVQYWFRIDHQANKMILLIS